MRVLTFGWDYPPIKNGGLGVACMGLTTELARDGVEIIFVLPHQQPVDAPFRFIFADIEPVKTIAVDSFAMPYQSSNSLVTAITADGKVLTYGRTIVEEAYRYAEKAAIIAAQEEFDLIHAHDWVSYLAGMRAKEVSGKPLILHVHATSFDQAGGEHADPAIYEIERRAFAAADNIVTVSNFTKNRIVDKHSADSRKIIVVHNGCDPTQPTMFEPVLKEYHRQGKKVILYHGRITIQKGPDYFIRAARKVVDVDPNVMFIISGWGDMQHQMMHLVGSLGLSDHVIFAGALWDEERDKMYQSVDLVVMPSVSEPFGLIPLEAIQHGTPTLISKQSGVAEVLTNTLKVDFWDIDEMANKMIAAIHYVPMNKQLVNEGQRELQSLSWKCAAQKVVQLYKRVLDSVRS